MTCHCDRLVVAFELPARPQPWRRAKRNGKRSFTDPRNVEYADRLGWACRTQMTGPAVKGDVFLWCLFEVRNRVRFDGDNGFKAIGDALNGVAYQDDRQVIDGRFHTVYGADVDRVSVAVLAVTA